MTIAFFWRLGAVVIFLSLCPAASAQLDPTKAFITDLGRTFGFCYGQHHNLDYIRKAFPELAQQVALAETSWNDVYKSAETNVEARLLAVDKTRWLPLRADLIERLESLMEAKEQTFTSETALKFMESIEQRASGVLSFPYRGVLLASNPDFMKSPELEFSQGFTGTYSTKDHPKAKGLELTLDHPLSWKQEETGLPDNVQKWTSDAGHGNVSFMVQIRKLPSILTKAELAQLFTEDYAKELISAESKLLKFSIGKLATLPLATAHSSQTLHRQNQSLETLSANSYLVYEDNFIMFLLVCAGDTTEAREKKFAAMEPLMNLMVNSLVIPGVDR